MLAALLLPRGWADEWISEEYRCALTIPTQESWTAALRQSLPTGAVVFHATSMMSSQGIMITHLADLSSSDIRNAAVLKRITDVIEAQGWSIATGSQIVLQNRPFIQYIAQRRDVVAGKMTGVIRVTPRGRNVYIVTAYGKGDADRSEDPDFMRVIETFRFIDQPVPVVNHPEGPSAKVYRVAMLASAGAAVALVMAFAVTVFFSQRWGQDSA